MNYLISMKKSLDDKPLAQKTMNEHETLNFIRRAMLGIQSMDETSADIRAISFMDKVKPGKAQIIENHKNGHCAVVQIDNH